MPLSKKVTPTKNVSQNAGSPTYKPQPRKIRKITSKARTSVKANQFAQGQNFDKQSRPFPNAKPQGGKGIGAG